MLDGGGKTTEKLGLVLGFVGAFLLGISLGDKGPWTFGDPAQREPAAAKDAEEKVIKPEEAPKDDKGVLGKFFAFQPPDIETIAKRLGYPDKDAALKEAKIFMDRVQAGYLPTAFNERCDSKEYSVKLCEAVRDYFAPRMQAGKGGRRRSSIPAFREKNMATLQAQDYQDLISHAPKSLSDIRKISVAALKTESCPRSASLALARAAESLVADPEARELMNKLDDHGMACLTPDDQYAETIYFRAGLFRYAHGQAESALALLGRAASTKIKREQSRVLYWKWRVARSLGKNDAAEETLLELKTSFPAAWHSILAQTETGSDPMKYFQGNASYPDTDISGNSSFDARLLWLQLLFKLDDTSRAGLARYGEFVEDNLPLDGPPGLLQFFARHVEAQGFHRLQILALSSLMQERPSAFHVGLLKLLYPRPFFDEFRQESAEQIDLAVLYALARQESSFDAGAVSSANAHGLFQVLPSTARTIRRKAKLTNRMQSIHIGSRYLVQMVKLFDGSIEKSLAAYNAGQGTLRNWEARYAFIPFTIEDPQLFVDLMPYRETRDYVSSILRNAYWYRRLYPDFSQLGRQETYTSHALGKALAKTEKKTEVKPASDK